MGFYQLFASELWDRGADDQDIHTQSAAVLSSGSSARNDNEEALDSEDDEQDVQGDNNNTSDKSPLSWLMSRLSFIARSLIINRPSGHEQIRSFVSRHRCLGSHDVSDGLKR